MEYSHFTFPMSNTPLAKLSDDGTVWWGGGGAFGNYS